MYMINNLLLTTSSISLSIILIINCVFDNLMPGYVEDTMRIIVSSDSTLMSLIIVILKHKSFPLE